MTRFLALLLTLLAPAAAVAQESVDVAVGAVHRALDPTREDPDLRFRFETSLRSVLGGEWFQAVDGRATVTVSARRVGNGLERVIEIESPAVYVRGVNLGALSARVWMPARADVLAAVAGSIKGSKHRLELSGRGAIGFNAGTRAWSIDEATVYGRADLLLGGLDAFVDEGVSTGAVVARVTRDAPGAPVLMSGQLNDLSFAGTSYGDARLNGRWQGTELTAQAQLDRAGALLGNITASFVVPDGKLRRLAEGEGKVEANLFGIQPKDLQPWFRPTAGIDYRMNVAAKAAGKPGRWTLTAEANGDASLPGAQAQLLGRLVGDQDSQRWTGTWGDFGSFDATTSLAREWRSAPFEGALDLELPLEALQPLARFLGDPEGQLTAKLRAKGTLGAPNISGPVATTDAAVTIVPANRRVTFTTAEGAFADDVLDFELVGKSGPGVVTASGKVAVRPAELTVDSTVSLVAEKFPVVSTDFPIALVGTAMDLHHVVSPDGRETSVDVRRGVARLLEETLPDVKTIPSNDDIEFVDHVSAPAARRGFRERWSVQLDQPLRVVGAGTDVAVTGGINVEREGDIVRVDGAFDTEALSTFDLFDNKFAIRAGRLSIQPGNLRRPLRLNDTGLVEPAPLAPTIELVAERKAEDTWVLVRLTGAFKKPELTLKSLPALPEYQIMTLLITGRVDTVDDRSGNVRRAVAKLVERYHNPSLERQLFDRIGIDKVGLGFRSSVTNPVLTVGKQITKTLYFETIYRHSAPPDLNMMEGHVEKRFGRSWTVDTVFGDAAEGRLGVFWRTTFGGPPRPKPSDEDLQLVIGGTVDSDGDGVPDVFDVCNGVVEDKDGFQDEDGCPDPDNDGDGIADSDDGDPMVAETFNGVADEDGTPDVWPDEVAAIAGATRSLRFERNQSSLTREHRAQLRRAVQLIRELPDARLLVEGHSDATGDARTIERVSEQRAAAVARELRRLGVARGRIVTISYGAQRPAVGASDDVEPGGQEANRRVEIKLEPLPADP